MPVNILRLNARHQQPNPRISFIKALPGPEATIAEEFLSRVAAISVPIMRAHHLSITTLEEHEPNKEFIGRNFNNGEIVQLVLRVRSGGWMSFRSVVMVFMHELAHNVQMNHGREFWKLTNLYKEMMRELWGKGYHGEGVWGMGRELVSGEVDVWGGMTGDDIPVNLCGGTFRSRRRKRRRVEEKVTYQERKERRILKKFGSGGVRLGADEQARTGLEKKSVKSNPRVAQSRRGKELRAAAALKRLESGRHESDEVKNEYGGNNETDSEYEEDAKGEVAHDANGQTMRDHSGNPMVKLEEAEQEGVAEVHVKSEMQELRSLNDIPIAPKKSSARSEKDISNQHTKVPSAATPERSALQSVSSTNITCSICSVDNPHSALLCSVCSHVLDISKSSGAWKCESAPCEEAGYLNSVDCGVCGLCGIKKPG